MFCEALINSTNISRREEEDGWVGKKEEMVKTGGSQSGGDRR